MRLKARSRMPFRSVLSLFACVLVGGLSAAVGCTPLGGRPSLASSLQNENPAVRVQGCVRASGEGDEESLQLLVDRLADPGADVRFFAIGALRKRTGLSFGYRYFDDAAKRAPAVRRWRQWLDAKQAGEGG